MLMTMISLSNCYPPCRRKIISGAAATALSPIQDGRCTIQSVLPFSTTTTTTSASISSSEKYKVASLRLFRMLQRQCKEMTKVTINANHHYHNYSSSNNDPILIQPMLQAPDWGKHAMFIAPSETKPFDIYQLFYLWIQEEHESDIIDDTIETAIDDWFYQVTSGVIPTQQQPQADDEYDHDNDDDDTYSAPYDKHNNNSHMSYSHWVTPKQLQSIIKQAFRVNYTRINETSHVLLHQWAIRAIQMLRSQAQLWKHSSVMTTEQIRVVATSRCIGTTTPAGALPPSVIPEMMEPKYRFSYRIRIENLSPHHVQLIGRYWNIQELTPDNTIITNKIDIEDNEQQQQEQQRQRRPIIVDSPVTGAVGQLPVLRPGECFEYMSGTDLATTKGIMRGHFYMARVPPNSPSAKSGDAIEALHVQDKMEITVAPFLLSAE